LIKNNRDGKRVQIPGELFAEVMVFQPMAIKEISRGGVQVETAFPLNLDSLYECRLTLGDRSVVLKGRAVHCTISHAEQELIVYRSGLEFVDASERVDDAVAAFVQAITDGRAL
jgi:hypothetical protein